MPNIVICLDGTGNEVKAKAVTNVFKISEVIDLTDPTSQLLYYGPGVGTLPAPGAWTRFARVISKNIGGLGLGHGMRHDIEQAYTYLMNTWQPGDKVFVFGFSRGAYTARALCGMLYRVGLLRPGSDNLVPYAVRVYARHPGRDSNLAAPEGWDRMDRFAEGLSRRRDGDRLSFPVHFLGLFDTVKGTGIIGRDISWPYTNQLPNVEVVRHAVSIDETRRPFRESLVPVPQDADAPQVTEAWFAGVHSDVGGGFADDPELGDISMRWMLDGATAVGLRVRPQRFRNRYTLNEKDASVPIHRNGRLWALAGNRRRRIPEGARIHGSVQTRIAAEDYHPKLSRTYEWEDEQWWGPTSLPPTHSTR